MMEYFDTNIFVYAFCKNVDNHEQKEFPQALLKEKASKNTLLVSDIVLYGFAFVCQKLKEEPKTIQKNLKFLSRFIKVEDSNIHNRVIEILERTGLYKSSFDIFYLAFCERYNCKLVTFDKGFKKLQDISNIEIDIR